MKPITFIFLGFLVSAGFPSMAQHLIKGTLVSERDGLPIQGAHIKLWDRDIFGVSDSTGNFSLNSPQKGSVKLIISHIAYQTKQQTISVPQSGKPTISLAEAVYMSDEVVVNSGRASAATPLTYSQLNNRDLNRNSFGADLPYLLQSTPSLVVSSDGGSGVGYTALRIRGSDLTRINVTMNGVPVNDAESHGVFFVDLPDLSSSVDNIQIQRGVGTSANGIAAFGASINIKTKMVDEEAGGFVSSSAGSFHTLKNTLGFSTGKSKQGFSLHGRLSKISSDGYIDRAWSDLKSYYLAASWSDQKTLVSLITTSGLQSTYQAWYGIPKDSLRTNRTYNPSGEMLDANNNITGYYPNQTDNYQQDYYQLQLVRKLSHNLVANGAIFLTNGKGYYESWKNDQSFDKYGLSDLLAGDTVIERTDLIQQKWLDNSFYGFHMNLLYEKNRLSGSFGGGWNQYDGDHFGLITWAKYYPDQSPPFTWYENNGIKTDYHFFAKAHFQLTKKVNLFGDMQYRHIGYIMRGTHDDLRDIGQKHYFDFLNPKAGVFLTINSQNKAYFSVSVSNREPNRSVYRDADPQQQITHEQLTDYEIGYQFNNEAVTYSVNAYLMQYANQLVLTGKINNVGAPIMTNVPESYRLGLENMFNWKITKRIGLDAHLSLSQNKILKFTEFVDNWNYWDDPDNEPYQYIFDLGTTDISFSPEIVGGLSLHISPLRSLDFSVNTNYVSRQYLDNTSNKSRSLDPYFVNNLLLAFQVPQSIFKEVELRFSLNNWLNETFESYGWVYKYVYDNEEYVIDGYFPQAGIHGMVGLTIVF